MTSPEGYEHSHSHGCCSPVAVGRVSAHRAGHNHDTKRSNVNQPCDQSVKVLRHVACRCSIAEQNDQNCALAPSQPDIDLSQSALYAPDSDTKFIFAKRAA